MANVDWLKQTIEKYISVNVLNEKAKKEFAGLVEVISLLYLGLILETSKMYQNFDFNVIISPIIKAIDKCDNLDKSDVLRGRDNKDYYEKIITEVKVEKKELLRTGL